MSKVTVSGTGGNSSALEAWSGRRGREPVRPGGDREGGGPDREKPGRAGAGWGWRRLGAGSRSSHAGAPVPARPLSSHSRRLSPKGESQPREAPSAASTPLGAAILCAKGWGERGRDDGLWPIGEGQWQKSRKAIGHFERCQNDMVSNEGGGKKLSIKTLLFEAVIGLFACQYNPHPAS